MKDAVTIRAGEKALQSIKDGSFKANNIISMAGAAGGPKWFVLSNLDKALFGTIFKNRKKPLSLIGSSIGAWRFSALSLKDPVSAITRLEELYLGQKYSLRPSAEEISREAEIMLNEYIPDKNIKYILNHPFIKLNIIAAKSKPLISTEKKELLIAAFAAAYLTNAVSRNSLSYFFKRIIFQTHSEIFPYTFTDKIETSYCGLTESNFKQAVMASGSIPLAMKGVYKINGIPDGVYRDGGMTDYHFDINFKCAEDEFCLYPHFSEKIIPGWLDKSIFWRKPHADNFKNVVIVSPSEKFISSLPYGKIPDRTDFKTFGENHSDRIKYWKKSVKESENISEEFIDLIQSGKIRNKILPLKGFK
ncbi:MAG: hypothetical protein KBH06_10940 [Spirochaetes bacterium]|nr:hypothetical protein [Spirochaetota bacterium]